MKHRTNWTAIILAAVMLGIPVTGQTVDNAGHLEHGEFLPGAAASKLVTVTIQGKAVTEITVLTEAVAIMETGPKATVTKFGEVYAFSPTFIAVHRDEPTRLTFWNLQPDDYHDFTLLGPDKRALMSVRLHPLTKTSFVFTFHQQGFFDFKCVQHQPEMAGQIIVLPPPGR